MKKSNLVISLLGLFVLCGCNAKPIEALGIQLRSRNGASVIEASEQEIQNILKYFRRTDSNIQEFKFVKLVSDVEVETSSEEFYRGLYDQVGLKLKCIYEDGKSKTVDLLSKRLPLSYNEALAEVGTHIFSIGYRGKDTTISLTTLYSEDTPNYYIRFYNYQNDVVYTTTCEYNTVYEGEIPEVPDREEDTKFIYAEKSWDQNISGQKIFGDVDVKPRYNPILKRNHARKPLVDDGTESVHRSLLDLSFWNHFGYFHVARIKRAPLLGYNTDVSDDNVVYHTEGSKDTVTCDFAGLIDTYEKQMKVYSDIMVSSMHYDDTEPAEFQAGNEKALPENFTNNLRYLSGIDFATLIHSFGGTNHTKFDEGGTIYDLYNTYIGDILDDYLEAHPNPVTATIPDTSQTGTYRLCVQADIDVIFVISTTDVSTKSNSELLKVETFFLVDEESVETVVDYDKLGEFNATSLVTFSSKDIYLDAISNLSD